MADPLNNIRGAYAELDRRVHRALRTQVGDAPRLREVRSQALSLWAAANQHITAFPPEEFRLLRASIGDMVADLDKACHQSQDPPEAAPLPVLQIVHTGRRGRPKKTIDPTFLRYALDMRGPSAISRVLGCSGRTVRREALRHGLVPAAPPVFSRITLPDGTTSVQHTTVTAPVSTMTDAQLDSIIRDILLAFPTYGRKLVQGALLSRGHRVPEDRIRQAYVRFVNHTFIDGHSRLVTGMRIHTNNRAATVLDLFLETVQRHGLPSRGRRIYGTGKWKAFFLELEHSCGLDADRDDHIWQLWVSALTFCSRLGVRRARATSIDNPVV
ncbi:hypothetical protein C8Q76DRAFT_825493 [Earliella scabrosa]|nr:hypothetical protein C8Q76DRAFT_825493 [Earliella scabrosa]